MASFTTKQGQDLFRICELEFWQAEATEAMSMAIGALASQKRGFAQEALIRCCVLVGSDPEDWTTHPETMRARRSLLPKMYR